MGKASREARKLAELQEMAQDLTGIQFRKYLNKGFYADPVSIRTSLGPGMGVALRFIMNDDSEHDPIILDPLGMINLICSISTVLAGRAVPAPQPPDEAESGADQGDTQQATGQQAPGEATTPSGLILPT